MHMPNPVAYDRTLTEIVVEEFFRARVKNLLRVKGKSLQLQDITQAVGVDEDRARDYLKDMGHRGPHFHCFHQPHSLLRPALRPAMIRLLGRRQGPQPGEAFLRISHRRRGDEILGDGQGLPRPPKARGQTKRLIPK